MDDPFFAEDDGEFDDFYGNGARKSSRTAQSMPRPSEANESRAAPATKDSSLVYPDTPASSVASFVSRSTDGGMVSVSTVTTPHHGASGHEGTAQKKPKKLRRKRSQERFEVAWEKDGDVTACFVCSTEFSLLKRKHHCRHCGRVICSDCSSFRRFASSRGKHRVCSYCSVEIANGGGGRHTMGSGAASMSDVEATTSQHQGGQDQRKLRYSVVGMFSSKSADARPRAPVVSSRKSDSYKPPGKDPSGELFDTGDDTWFGDPVDIHGTQDKRRRGKEDHHSQQMPRPSQSQAAAKHKDSYARPQVVHAPDSLFDVQFTNGNQFDAESEDDDHDNFEMPAPTSQSETSPAVPHGNDIHTSARGSKVGRLDAPMSMEDLQTSSASASYISSSGQFEAALLATSSKSRRADRTFYNDDVDDVVVDEAPGYYDSVLRDRNPIQNGTPSYTNAVPMPRPLGLAEVSDNSSGTLVEAPEMNASSAQIPVTKDEERSPEEKSLTGALKRFFGISKNKRGARSTTQPMVPSARHETDKSASTQPSSSDVVHTVHPHEQRIAVEMPRPDVVAPAESDHYEAIDMHPRDIHISDARRTIAEENRPKVELPRDGFETPLRHTMAGYVMPSARAESLMRASVVGSAVQPEPTRQQVARNTSRTSTRSRRDTFDDLFDMPTKSSKASAVPTPHAAPVPSQAWIPAYDTPVSVGVARFDRPGRDDEDDSITRDLLELPVASQDSGGLDPRASTARTPWSTVGSYRSTGDTTVYARPDAYGSSRHASGGHHNHYGATRIDSSLVASEYDESSNYSESGQGSVPKRTIMEDLKPTSTFQSSPRNGARQNTSLDDYFADFEKPPEYVFDTATGTYVSADPRQARQSVIGGTTQIYAQPSPVPTRTMEQRDERVRQPTRSIDLLEPVREDASDEIDGIIADKISTLAGELEALKQLLRHRRVHASPTSAGAGAASTASRKQSIFDSDGSDDEVSQHAFKVPKEKRRSSSKKTAGSDGATRKNWQTRKDSFADLFEDDPEEIEDRQGAVPRNYEALFRLGQDTEKRVDSDDGDDDSKLSRRGILRGSKVARQRDVESNSESDSDSHHTNHATSISSSRFKHGNFGREESIVSPTLRDEDKSTQAPVAPAVTTRPRQKFAPKKAKRDAIDSLFDSDSDQDMGQLYEATGVAQAPRAVGRLDLLGKEVVSGSDDDTAANAMQGVELQKGNLGSQAMVLVGVKPNLDRSIHEVHNASSDEEFSSTLRNLRGRRKASTSIAKTSLLVRSQERADFDDAPHDLSDASSADQPTHASFRLSLLGDTVPSDVAPFEPTPGNRAMQSVTPELAVPDKQEHHAHDPNRVEVKPDADPSHDVASDQQFFQFEQKGAVGETPAVDPFNYDSTSDATQYDPLALLDEKSEISRGRRSGRTAESTVPTIDSAAAPTPWGSDIGAIGDRLKAVRFRDSLLDDSAADLPESSASLNLDDLFGGHDNGSDDHYGEKVGEQEQISSDEDEGFSFEFKAKKRTRPTVRSTVQPPESDKTKGAAVSVSGVEEGETTPAKDELHVASANGMDKKPSDADILGTIAEETNWGAVSIASSTDDAEPIPEADTVQFQDDWQRMQEQEKERKKKLQMKQRQAQRDKLKKQSSSVRSLSKSGSTRGFAPPPSSPATSTSKKLEQVSTEGSELKKKKKHRKKTEDGIGDGDAESQSTRKAEKRQQKRFAV